jgi:hypothetical protein
MGKEEICMTVILRGLLEDKNLEGKLIIWLLYSDISTVVVVKIPVRRSGRLLQRFVASSGRGLRHLAGSVKWTSVRLAGNVKK